MMSTLRGTPRRSWALVGALAIVVASGCSSNNAGSNSSGPGGEIKIGALEPLSGLTATGGKDTMQGIELAVEVINGTHPEIGLPLAKDAGLPNLGGARLKLVAADTTGDPQKGASEAERLINDEKVVALTGGYASAVTTTASERGERLKVPYVNGESSAVSLTERGLSWFFRVGPTDRTYGTAFFSMLKQLGSQGKQVSNIAVIHTNDTFGNDGFTITKQLADEAGYKVVADVPYDAKTNDLTSQVQQLRSANPNVVFALSFAKDALLMVQAMKQLNWRPDALMAYGAGWADAGFTKNAGVLNAGFCRRVAWSAELATRNPTAKAVADLYQQKYGVPMTENSARSFTAMYTLAQAINAAGSSDPEKIRSALQNIDIPGRDTIMPWDGIKFGDNHQNTGARGVVEQFIKGEYHVVFPDDVKNTQVVWPASNSDAA